ncbi:MAG: glycosyltransferase family 4 protein [Nitrospinae bacterium]|nr:glycosyltransferase family 4 protein [Nitrospinota bacterium]
MVTKTRVVHFTNHIGFGGTEKTIYTFLKYLNRDKFDLSVAAFSADKGIGREAAIRALGVDVRVTSPKYLSRYLAEIKPDIFHIHREGGPEPGPISQAKQAGVPVVIEHNVFGRFDKSAENELIDCHIFVSYSCGWRYQMWAGHPLVGAKYQVLYNPVEVRQYAAHGFENRDFTRKSIGRIGRPDDTKWEFNFLEAIPLIVERFPDLEFHIIGVTPAVEEKLKKMGVWKNVRLLPLTTDEREIMKFYGEISVLTHFASMGETFGLVLAEGMSARLPVVTHHTPAITDGAHMELVNDAYNGFIARNAEVYADAVIYLLSNPDAARKMGERGFEKAMASYEASAITKGLESIYLLALREKRAV